MCGITKKRRSEKWLLDGILKNTRYLPTKTNQQNFCLLYGFLFLLLKIWPQTWWQKQKYILLQLSRPKSEISITGPPSMFWQGWTLFRGSGVHSLPCHFHLLMTFSISWITTTSLQSPWSHYPSLLCGQLFLCFLFIKDICDCI